MILGGNQISVAANRGHKSKKDKKKKMEYKQKKLDVNIIQAFAADNNKWTKW